MSIPVFSSRQTISEAVAAQLREDIQRGLLQPGDRLRQGEIATRFGVSTTPVREAFQLLQAEGLVRTDPHRGAIVFRPTAADVREAYEIREALEHLAIEKAMDNGITPELLDELEAILDRMDEEEDESAWIELNHAFHLKMYEASQRPRLCSILTNVRDASSGYIHMVIYNAKRSGRAGEEHRRILSALRDNDLAEAKEAIRVHLHHTVEHVLDYVEGIAAPDGVARPRGSSG